MKKNIYLSVSQIFNEGSRTMTTIKFYQHRRSFRKVGFLGFLLLMVVAPAFAQTQSEKAKKEIVPAQTIKGVVLSEEDSSALEGANIILKGTGVGTIADRQGRFVFPQQLMEGDVLLFSFVNTQTLEYKVPAQAEDSIVIKMKMGFDLTGDLAVGEIYTKPTRRHK